MRKLLQTTSVLILGIGLLTGCSDGKVAKKIETASINNQTATVNYDNEESAFDKVIDSQTTDEPVAAVSSHITKTTLPQIATTKKVENNKENTTSQDKKVQVQANKVAESAEKNNADAVQNSKHNFKEAAKVLNPMAYGLINYSEGNNALNVFRYALSQQYGNDDNNVKTVPVSKILDLVNTYNTGTYDVNAVLEKLQQSGVLVMVQDRSIETFDEQTINEIIPNKTTVIYFKNDGLFALRTVTGYGGASSSIFAPTDSWKVNGDEIVVPYETVATKKPTGKMILHLNDKNYGPSQNKTMYYVENFVIY